MRFTRRALPALLLLAGSVAPILAQTAPDTARARAEYVRGRELLARGDAHIPSPGDILRGLTFWEDFLAAIGKDHVSRARDAFRASLAADSMFAPSAVELGKLALASRDPGDLGEAARALERTAGERGAAVETLRVAAQVATAVGDTAEAASLARAYSTASGRDASLARLLLSRAEILAGRDVDGWKDYTAGLDSLTAHAAKEYLAGLGPLSGDAADADWEDLPLAARGEWLRRYWLNRAAAGGRAPAAVLAEHERRLRYALVHYPRTSRRKVTAVTADVVTHGLSSGLDDRGVMYVRHGEPDRVVKTPVNGCLPHESWLYNGPDGPTIYHFVALNRPTEFELVANPLAGCEDSSARGRELGALSSLDARYAALEAQANLAGASGGSSVGDEFYNDLNRLITERRGDAIEGLRKSGYAPRARAVLPFYYDTYAFRGDSGRTDVVATLAIPGDALRGSPSAGGVHYDADVGFALLDTLATGTYQTDTSLHFTLPRALRDRENLRVSLQLPVPPGAGYAQHVTVRLPGRDVEGDYGGATVIPSFRGDTLMVSDLVMAESAGHGWHRGKVELGLVPPRQYDRGPISLFYELYNLPPDSAYTTRIRVTPMGHKGLLDRVFGLFSHGGAVLSVSFRDVAHPSSDGTVQVLRHLDLSQLKPGPYRLELETHVAGRTVRRETDFVVRNR